ncbi:TMV resistance protein N-like [Nicotiana tabacum]|uniref:TMV resistance protein N-like n=1 Tax=Nicotiana tabacum TaxID=4097 RepID=A0AC58UQB5_TOBAC
MECKDQCGQTVIPVFHDMDPSHVRKQRESFAEAFDKHETSYKDDDEGIEKLQRWRNALTAAANLKGYDVSDGEYSDEISKLCNSTTLSSLRDIVGIDTHPEKLKSLLKIGINGVRIILGIWGMGGLGKTTIARAILTLYHINLKLLVSLRILKKMKTDINCDIGRFVNGSRVVVTTRAKHLIEKDAAIYEVTMLPDHEAMQLFCQRAFDKENPDEHFKKLSLERTMAMEAIWVSSYSGTLLISNEVMKNMKRLRILNIEGWWIYDGSINSLHWLEKIPEIHGRMKPKIQIHMEDSGIRELPSSIFQYQTHITELNLRGTRNLVALPSSICRLKNLISLSVLDFSKLESLPEEIGDLENLEELDARDSLSLRVFTSEVPDDDIPEIPSWFLHKRRDRSVLVNLPENWYILDKFLGFVVCYSGRLVDTTTQLIPVCDDGMSWMTQKLALSEWATESNIPFSTVFFVCTPNDYEIIWLSFSGEVKRYGLRLLYKEEAKVEALSRMRENNNEPTEYSTGIRRTRYNNSEYKVMINEASCSSGKKQKSHISNFQGNSVFENL